MADTSATLLLRTEPIGKLLLRYSLPAIAAMVVFSLYNIIDSIFIGHGVGPLAISGLAITFPVMNLTFALVLLVGIGGASICSIRLGQQDIDGATRVLGNVLLLGLINGVTFGLLSQLVLDPVLTAFGASEHTLPYARDFMQIILYGLPVTCTMFGLNHIMRATGYPQKAMLSAVLTVGMNIILAPIFIFWLEWGIRGAAIATVLSQCVGMVWVLSHFRNPKSTVHFRQGTFRLRWKIVSSIFSIGMSPFLLNVCACLVTVLINIGLKRYGGDMAIGAFGILNRILILFVMLVMGLTQGMAAHCGIQLWGAAVRTGKTDAEVRRHHGRADHDGGVPCRAVRSGNRVPDVHRRRGPDRPLRGRYAPRYAGIPLGWHPDRRRQLFPVHRQGQTVDFPFSDASAAVPGPLPAHSAAFL